MGFYHLDLDALSKYTGINIEELKQKSYDELEKMIKDMESDKIIKRNNRNASDEEYERLVLKYFEPLSLLRHWFDEKEIVLACAHTGVSNHDLCQEMFVNPGDTCYRSNNEFIRTSWESVPQYDAHGRELMERKRKQMDVYRIANQYQGLSHGQVILHLLYTHYPELSKFGFSAYGMSGEWDYEIYPKNNIYTSLTALMSGDIDFILHRNREYCKSYNNGRYSPAECEKAFHTKEAQEMFNLICKIGEKENVAGHSMCTVNENGQLETAHGLVETKVSASNNIKLLQQEASRSPAGAQSAFKLACVTPYTVEQMLHEFIDMVKPTVVNVHICYVTDYLNEHGLNLKMGPEEADHMNIKDDNGKDYSGYIVNSTFGWSFGNKHDLTIRINPYHK